MWKRLLCWMFGHVWGFPRRKWVHAGLVSGEKRTWRCTRCPAVRRVFVAQRDTRLPDRGGVLDGPGGTPGWAGGD